MIFKNKIRLTQKDILSPISKSIRCDVLFRLQNFISNPRTSNGLKSVIFSYKMRGCLLSKQAKWRELRGDSDFLCELLSSLYLFPAQSTCAKFPVISSNL